MSRTLRFRTPDMRFGLIVDATITGKILMLCRESGRVETGGILVGYYTEKHDWAIVTDVSGPPVDSKRGYVFFNRGVQGLQKWLNQIWWWKRQYYIGEWHYHPFNRPKASPEDTHQLQEHSVNVRLVCPEPLMLIIGGNPNGAWEAGAYVFPQGKSLLTMDGVT